MKRQSLGVGKGRIVRILYNLCMISANCWASPGLPIWDLVGHGTYLSLQNFNELFARETREVVSSYPSFIILDRAKVVSRKRSIKVESLSNFICVFFTKEFPCLRPWYDESFLLDWSLLLTFLESLSPVIYMMELLDISPTTAGISVGTGGVFRLEGKVKCSGEKQILYSITVSQTRDSRYFTWCQPESANQWEIRLGVSGWM